MSSEVKLSGDAAGRIILQGNDTITTDQTFTFPDTGGEVLISDSNGDASLTGAIDAKNTAGAWVNFAGNGSIGAQNIRTSYNVSGVEKTGTGRYTISFTRAFSDNDVCVALVSNQNAAWIDNVGASSVSISTADSNFTRVDASLVNLIVYGNY